MTDMTGHLAHIEIWDGQHYEARYVQDGPNHWRPDMQPISAEEYFRLKAAMVEFESPFQPDPTITFYELEPQRQAAALEEYTDALNERNKMAADAAAGYL